MSEFVPAIGWVAPFVALLLGVAVLPLAAPHFWESNRNKLIVSLLLGAPVALLYAWHHPAVLLETGAEYVSFIVLLGSLFVISGGVLMDGDLEATPAVNTGFLALGALIASFVGTTGASMLLIRPVLHTNSERNNVVHTVVFFIFLVSNIGGCLTPLGDPPLFLGYLQGVPFNWTFRLAPEWFVTTALLLVIYYIWDTRAHAAEQPPRLRADRIIIEPITIRGKVNLVLLGGILAAAATLHSPWREVAMVALTVASLVLTPRGIHAANHFTWHPIVEVAVLFIGIFATMIPALELLHLHGAALGVREPWQYFWATGLLSSFLDNAPTYLTFLALGQGQGLAAEVVGVPHEILAAISLGAVFMGANSYIGNGPNFMVRSIAESRGVKMPTFGGYLVYTATVLLPVFGVITLVFFR
jgi:Na+/H+ antiporter NhaD/arsenite permease-like protein